MGPYQNQNSGGANPNFWLSNANQNNQNNLNGGVLSNTFSPYMNAGMAQLPGLENSYAAMQNPNFINTMGQGFQQSPGFQFQVNQALGSANRAAAAGGMLGTPQEQQFIAGTTNQLANQDYYNWLNHALSSYGMGLQGQQGLYNTGFNAATQYGTDLSQALMAQAQLAYAGAANQNQSSGGGLGSMLGGLGGMVGGMFGGGSSGGSSGGSGIPQI